MENLINFDDDPVDENELNRPVSPLPFSPELIVPMVGRLSMDTNNPFDKFQYRAEQSDDDPFNIICLEKKKKTTEPPSRDSAISTSSSFSIDKGFINYHNTNLSTNNPFASTSEIGISLEHGLLTDSFDRVSTISSIHEDTHKRTQSDSSSVSGKIENPKPRVSRCNSVDNGALGTKKYNQQLLKLSFYNSQSLPLNSAQFSSSMMDTLFQDTKSKLNINEPEDINNITLPIDLVNTSNPSNISILSTTDLEMENFKIAFLEQNQENPKQAATGTRVSDEIKAKLKKIKKEAADDCTSEPAPISNDVFASIKSEKLSPKQHVDNGPGDNTAKSSDDEELVAVIRNLKEVVLSNDKDSARKYMQRLNELIGPSPETPSQPKTLQVQPLPRQGTFDIDTSTTGERKNIPEIDPVESEKDFNQRELVQKKEHIMRGLSKWLDSISFDTLNNASNPVNPNLIIIAPPSIAIPSSATPCKQPINTRRSVSLSLTQKPQSALKAIESKRLNTPMKAALTTSTSIGRRSSFTTPRPSFTNKSLHPYEQKLVPQRGTVGSVRKSLMLGASPAKKETDNAMRLSCRPSTAAAAPRRTSSMKNVPAVQVTQPSPTKRNLAASSSRPSTTMPSRNSLKTAAIPGSRRLSQVSATSVRPSTRVSAVNRSRTLSDGRKLDGSSLKPLSKANNNSGSLV